MLTDKKIPDITIVLPAYNPPADWAQKSIKAIQYLQERLNNPDIELIVVNDGSKIWDTDTGNKLTAAIPGCRLLTHPVNMGKGEALRTGVREAKGNIILMTDIDWPYTYDSVIQIIKSLSNGNDVALGHRSADYYKDMPRARQIISNVLRNMNARLLNLVSDDTQCGLKGMKNDIKELFLHTTTRRYLFDLEFVKIISRKKTLKIDIVPVTLRPGVVFTKMRLSVLIKESINFFNILWRNQK